MNKERPILFNTEMVQAVLAGRKTQTRRVIKPQPNKGWGPDHYCELHKLVDGEPDINKPIGWGVCSSDGHEGYRSPYGKPGDLLWVRENWRWFDALLESDQDGVYSGYQYKAQTPDPDDYKWKPSIFMPKEASRIWLKVTDVRVERVQDISTEDIKAEGINYKAYLTNQGYHLHHKEGSYRGAFHALWNSINADRKDKHGNPLNYDYESNPWVWVVCFEVISTDGRPTGDRGNWNGFPAIDTEGKPCQ